MEQGAGETILVIDDEQTIRMLIAEVLGDAGYTTLEAADGPSGLRILQSDARIDLLITDVGLPGGLNGRQVADAAVQDDEGGGGRHAQCLGFVCGVARQSCTHLAHSRRV